MSFTRRTWVSLALLVFMLAGWVILMAVFRNEHPVNDQAAVNTSHRNPNFAETPIVTNVTAAPAHTAPAAPSTQYIDIVQRSFPRLAGVKPYAVPVNLADAAHLVIKEPIYLSPRGDLWITHADAHPAENVIQIAEKRQNDGQLTLAVRDKVLFAHWRPADQLWSFDLVVQRPDGRAEIVTSKGRVLLPWDRHFQWDRAVEWNEEVIVPTDTGVSVIRFFPEPAENFYELAPGGEALSSAPQVIFDWAGFLAWIPWDEGHPGSDGAVRYVDGKWTPLTPAAGWPARPMQLLPLSDGSVLTIEADQAPLQVKLASITLEKLDIDQKAVFALVDQLNDEAQENRDAAFAKLAGYGPGIWPILEKLGKNQLPEAKLRIHQLLKTKSAPTLNGMTLIVPKLKPITRHQDGGALFYAPAGVSIPTSAAAPTFIMPAWIDIRPGPFVTLVDAAMVKDLKPDAGRIWSTGRDWIVSSDARGPRLFYGNGFISLLKGDETQFDQLIGKDARGRWLFRKVQKPDGAGETLIIDPTLPSPTPRLPVWVYVPCEVVGWDENDWPVVKKNGTWVLKETDWVGMALTAKMFTEAPAVPLQRTTTQPAATQPAAKVAITGPTTSVATAPATASVATSQRADGDPPILALDDGTRYFDGVTQLVCESAGKRDAWSLPPQALGTGRPWLVRASDGTLYLFNQPGRVLRIRATPGEKEPFALDATFTKKIPHVPSAQRIWLDPAGRIVMAYENQLAFLFPQGFIPPGIAQKMPADQLDLDTD